MTDNNEQIKEINQHIKDALEQWCDIMLQSEVDQWAYLLDYDERDVFNALFILQSVASNYAIKHGHIKNEDDAFTAGLEVRDVMKKYYGIDTTNLIKPNEED